MVIAITVSTRVLVLENNPIQTVDPDTIASLNAEFLLFGYYPLSLQVIRNITLGVSKSTAIENLSIQFLRGRIDHVCCG